MMKVFKTLMCITLGLSLFGCTNNSTTEKKEESSQTTSTIQIKTSPDKYTQYVKNYVGKNCANVGYKSMGGDRMDRYGNEAIKIVMVTEDGEYPGDEDEDLKGYVVVQQNLKPNTEIKMTYQKKDDGEEYDNLVDWCNIHEIVLKVGKTKFGSFNKLTEIKSAPDKYTDYVKDYVGRNLFSCGYVSMINDFRDHYGAGTSNIQLILNAEDGSYIDVEDEENLKNYVVTSQNIAPNTEIQFTYDKDSDGNEQSFPSYTSINEIELTLKKLNS